MEMRVVWCLLILLWGQTRAFSSSSLNYLTDAEINRVREWMPIYQRAAELVGVPPMSLPTLHFRESDLQPTWQEQPEERWIWMHQNHIPYQNVGGPFMLDLGANGDRDEFDARIHRFERIVADRFGMDYPVHVRFNFYFACLCAAVELQGKSHQPMVGRMGRVVRSVLADAFRGYNGRCPTDRSWKTCAYVSNDPKHGKRFTVTCRMGICTTQYVDDRPGTLIVYDELVRRIH